MRWKSPIDAQVPVHASYSYNDRYCMITHWLGTTCFLVITLKYLPTIFQVSNPVYS